MAKVAILGYGTVGGGVAEVLDRNREEVRASAGGEVALKYILDIREFPGDPHEAQIVHDYETILNDPEIDVICETMGGLNVAYDFTKRALEQGKSVCTSNKELVAAHGPELVALAKAHACSYLFEASVGGGIPILHVLNTSLRHEKIDAVTGILNGTTNYILTKMLEDGSSFDAVLKEAQEKGYAERHPEADVEGYDACRKTAILASLISGGFVDYQALKTEGITKISTEDFAYAKALHTEVKLLGLIRRTDEGLYAMVAPFLVPESHPLAGVRGVFNAVLVHGNMLDDTMYYGRGAGKEATASAVVADLIRCVRQAGRHIEVNMNTEAAVLTDVASVPHQFLVRTEASEEADAQALFGKDVDAVRAESTAGEYAFVTQALTEADFERRYAGLHAPRGYIRLYQ